MNLVTGNEMYELSIKLIGMIGMIDKDIHYLNSLGPTRPLHSTFLKKNCNNNMTKKIRKVEHFYIPVKNVSTLHRPLYNLTVRQNFVAK